MSSPTKRVAVIGAGVSGLVSIKCCNDEGLGPVCFEQSEEIAGIWNYHDNPREGDGAALYENLVTNTSKNMMCFSDFPFSREAPPYLRHHLVLRYYQQYAEHFGLYKFIKFNTKVLKIKPVANFSQTGQWEVYVKTNGQSERKEVYDAVMCCTGLNSSPYMPEIEGMDLFEGSVLHSNRFRRDSDFREKTVVVVGDAYSAGDVAVETSRCAKQVYISMRDGTFVIRRMGSKAIPIHERTHKRVMKLLPVAVRNYALETLVLSELNHTRMGLKSSKPMYKHRVMINDEIANRIFCGAVECKPVIQQLNKRSVKFVDGTVVDDVDAVICATGYNATFPYLDNDVLAG
ncbi:dimethylaniline monooxygenase [N-oxide-forming] 2-like [Saccoglossus kowalevskii]|uniref:Flavin-containing monooxygenase n=1 Tax=Saccoglossus kowalevskii TaxID=10224 RepID=A0ABM0M4U1_SACKO|nr:PREDICTED: dimethylaniline monooxygenase [N-oxide-forming] 2-like [Saccoglossus kowalevskii]